MYCTYLTTYYGSKLPPFYIGYSLIKNIQEKNYHGSPCSKEYAKVFKQEEQENPQLFKTNILTIHELREEAQLKEVQFQKSLKVVKNPLYINKAAGRSSSAGKTWTLTEEQRAKHKAPRNRKPGSGDGFKKGGIPWNKGLRINSKVTTE